MRLQVLAARLALVLVVLAALAAFGALAGVRLAHIPFDTGLAIMALATGLALAALANALFWLFSALKRNRGEGRPVGLIALICALVLLWPPLRSAYKQVTSPEIYDATTNPEDPPQFVALAARAPGENSPVYDGAKQIRFRGETNTANYMLHTYYVALTMPKAMLLMTKPRLFWRAFETAKDMGWHIVDYSEKEGRIEATDKSFWFGQTADIVIRVQESGSRGARLEARSANRSGTRDFGSNIERLEDYLVKLRARR